MPILIEACVDSIDDARAAVEAGANRIELSAALHQQGLTPPIDLQSAAGTLDVPVITMIRPRPGDFCYSRQEIEQMLADIDTARANGAAGIAVGILHESKQINIEDMVRMIEAAGDMEVVFHRAFDLTPDPLAAMQQLIDLNVTRILTSGQQPTALAGAALIAKLIDCAQGHIEILPAGGIGPANAAKIIRITGATQLHGSFRGKSDPARHADELFNTNGAAPYDSLFSPNRLKETIASLSGGPSL